MALARPMKVAEKAMKRAKAAAPKRGSKIARGRMAKAMVLRGSKEKTAGGLKREDLMRNKRNRVVSKRASAAGMRAFKQIEAWVDSVVEARRALHMTGFVAINGKSLQGKALYVKCKALLASRQPSAAPPAQKVAAEETPKRGPELAAAGA